MIRVKILPKYVINKWVSHSYSESAMSKNFSCNTLKQNQTVNLLRNKI